MPPEPRGPGQWRARHAHQPAHYAPPLGAGTRCPPTQRLRSIPTRQRPLGVPALEDKIVQRAAVEVLNAIYETDFLGFSYGFRPGRSQHQALGALYTGLLTRKVNWVLDVDIRGFFDGIFHAWLVKFI